MITYCIPSKNNLRYLKHSIQSIKDNSTVEYDIVIYVDADDDGTEAWLIKNGIRYLKNETNVPKGIAHGYNRCIEAATTPIVCMFHADMYMAKGFDVGILKYLKPLTVVSGTRIEPPLHPTGKEKIVENFGMYPEDFIKDLFDEYVQRLLTTNKDVTTRGIFAPWAIYKDDITKIGMHDETFHSYHEDSDIFNRFILSGYSIVQSWEAYVYHLTCRGGQFQDGIEKVTTDASFHTMKNNAMRNYLRKWGSWIRNDEYHYPIIPHKYNIAFVVSNCDLSLLEFLEPWCDRIYVDELFAVGRAWDYVETEQVNTHFDLSKRVMVTAHNDPPSENDIVVEFDARRLNNQNFQIIQQLADIISESGEVGDFELDIFKISIRSLDTYESGLINSIDPHHANQLV